MNLFPLIASNDIQAEEIPLCREVAWDFEQDKPIFKQGMPMTVEGKEAVQVWIWNALKTVRYRYEIYPWSYGCEVENLIGQPFTDAVKQSEAIRYVKECLAESPYIESVNGIQVSFDENVLSVECVVKTIYGEVKMDV